MSPSLHDDGRAPDQDLGALTSPGAEGQAPPYTSGRLSQSPDKGGVGVDPSLDLTGVRIGGERVSQVEEERGIPGRQNPKSFWSNIVEILRKEGPGIPASLSSTAMSLLILRPILGLESVKHVIGAAGSFGGSALSLIAMTLLWAQIYQKVTDPLFKKVSENIGISRKTKPEEESSNSDTRAKTTHLASSYWRNYIWGFNTVQFLGQAALLHAGMEPKSAQTWSSAVANVFWLIPLPFVKYSFQLLAEKKILESPASKD